MSVHIDAGALQRLQRRADVQRAATAMAREIADRVDAQHIQVGDDAPDGSTNIIDIPVEVYSDAESAAVVLAHPAGVAVQAKYGALTKAASQVGLTVKGD